MNDADFDGYHGNPCVARNILQPTFTVTVAMVITYFALDTNRKMHSLDNDGKTK